MGVAAGVTPERGVWNGALADVELHQSTSGATAGRAPMQGPRTPAPPHAARAREAGPAPSGLPRGGAGRARRGRGTRARAPRRCRGRRRAARAARAAPPRARSPRRAGGGRTRRARSPRCAPPRHSGRSVHLAHELGRPAVGGAGRRPPPGRPPGRSGPGASPPGDRRARAPPPGRGSRGGRCPASRRISSTSRRSSRAGWRRGSRRARRAAPPRARGEGAGERHALALAARELVRVALSAVLKAHQLEGSLGERFTLVALPP